MLISSELVKACCHVNKLRTWEVVLGFSHIRNPKAGLRCLELHNMYILETCFSVKHDAVSKILLEEGMLAYHITAVITACIVIIDMAIPLTRANRLAAMKESDERIHISHPSCEAPCVLRMP